MVKKAQQEQSVAEQEAGWSTVNPSHPSAPLPAEEGKGATQRVPRRRHNPPPQAPPPAQAEAVPTLYFRKNAYMGDPFKFYDDLEHYFWNN
jgi:hypothetical protein